MKMNKARASGPCFFGAGKSLKPQRHERSQPKKIFTAETQRFLFIELTLIYHSDTPHPGNIKTLKPFGFLCVSVVNELPLFAEASWSG
jgi:hypothetical protein